MSKQTKEYDYIIVGQGLAGSILAYTLLEGQKKLLLLHTDARQGASQVAAGIFNPITGRKMVKTWLADQLFPYLHLFYRQMEQKLNESFFYPLPMYFPFDTQGKQNDWLLRQNEDRYRQYTPTFYPKNLYPTQVTAPFGGMEISGSGYLNIGKMCARLRQYFQKKATFVETEAKKDEFSFSDTGVFWKNYRAKKLLLCDGMGDLCKSFFPKLDFRPVKGEVLDLKFTKAAFRHIVNRNGWILPLNNGSCKFGATYEKPTDCLPSEAGKSELLRRLSLLSPERYLILAHKAGIRPATYDRRPFLGLHPKNKQVGLFNGLGAKGVSLAPFLANEFAKYLDNKTDLMPEVNLLRCYSRKKSKSAKGK